MKKVIVSTFGGPEVLTVQEQAIPTPEADEIIIKVSYIGVGAIDTIMRSGGLKEVNLQPPFTPGIEVSGVVHSIGTDVHDIEVGQPVAAMMLPDGGYATYVRAKRVLSVAVPDEQYLSACASIVNLVTAHVMLTRIAPWQQGDSLAVHGATGGLGTACIQVAQLLQPSGSITGTVRNPSKKQYVESLGCQMVRTTEEFITEPEQQYVIIIDPIGGTLRTQSLNALRPYGTLLAVGNVSDDFASNVSSQQLWLEGKAVAGFNMALYASVFGDASQASMQAIVEALVSGRLQPTPSKEFAFEDIQKAHVQLEDSSFAGRVVVKVS